MKSVSLGTVWGVQLQLHWSFVLFFAFLAGALFLASPESAPPTLLLFFFLFLSVLLHELAHSIVSLYLGLKVSRIVLLPIGGMALTAGLPKKPSHEFFIAIAGPVFNFAVVGALLLLAAGLGLPFPWSVFSDPAPGALEKAMLAYPLFGVFYVNLMLGAFNLFFPALPLDGGRVARALLAMAVGQADATRAVGRASAALAALLFVFGLVHGSLLVMAVAAFVYLGARQETELARLQSLLQGVPYGWLVDRRPLVLPAEARVADAVHYLLGSEREHALVETARGWGLVRLEELAALGPARGGERVAAHAVPVQPVSTTQPPAQAALQLLASGAPVLPLVSPAGRLVGALDAALLESALRRARLLQRFPLPQRA